MFEWAMLRLAAKVFGALLLLLAILTSCTYLAHASDMAVGDSIGIGTGHALGVSTYGRVGAGSCEIVRRVPRATYRFAVISAGINDGGACVAAVRARVLAQRVVWILPAPINPGRAAVLAAMRPEDGSVSYDCAGGCTKSNFHPASYAVVAAAVRAAWGTTWQDTLSDTTSATSKRTPLVFRAMETPLMWMPPWPHRSGR